MKLRARLAPPLTELLHRQLEDLPLVIEGRRRLVAPAAGRVLELGAGPGFNLPYYGSGVGELVVTDQLPTMLPRARKRANRAIVTATADVEALEYENNSFDTVVASFLLCSVPRPEAALAEIRRVLRPGGQYLFLEHVRSPEPRVARKQDRWELPWRAVAFGCHPNRDTLGAIESHFDVTEVLRDRLPVGPEIVRPYVLGRAVKPATPV